MRALSIGLLAIILLSGCSMRVNRMNKHGQRTGKWIVYMDDDHKIKSFEGKFRDGRSVGKTLYYTNKGILDRKEMARGKKLKTTFYYANGVVKAKGNARVDNLSDKIHYYYYGKWYSYNEKGELEKYDYYNKGKYVRSVYVDKNNHMNDSLMFALNALEVEFNEHRNRWHDSISKHSNNPLKKAEYKQKYNEADSITFFQIDQILSTYGYPSSAVVGDAYIIPFYLLSFAPTALKEKHYHLLQSAVNKGILSPKSFAFFADKHRIAKGQKQLYGTQSYYNKDKKEIFYPSEDPDNLQQRRKSIGLEE